MYLNTVFKYNVFKYCPALPVAYDIHWARRADMSLIITRDFWASFHPFLHHYLTPGYNGSILIIFVVRNYLCGALGGVIPSFSLYFRSVPFVIN